LKQRNPNEPAYGAPSIVFVGAVGSVTKQTFTGNLCDGTPCDGTGWRKGASLDHEHIESEATKPRDVPSDETRSNS